MLLYLFLAIYFFVLITVFMYASHRYYMIYLYYRHRKNKPLPLAKIEHLPKVTIQLPVSDLSYWDEETSGWTLEEGSYTIHSASSSRDNRRSRRWPGMCQIVE